MRLRVRANAKVNLSLEVLARRSDGYHQIVSLAQAISLHDLVECLPSPELRVLTEPPLVGAAENLVTRAAELLARRVGRPPRAELLVRKRIPLAAGLGGGSSDAAAALRVLDRLWGTRLGRSGLMALAEQIGADVSLFLVGGAVLVRGKGELVYPLPHPAPFWLALACPPCPLPDKTRALYEALRPEDWSDGRRTLALADRAHPGWTPRGHPLVNAFDRAAEAIYPDFADLRRHLADAARAPLHLTGAGPSLFALFATRGEAAASAQRMRRVGVPCHVARSVLGLPRVRLIGPSARP